MKGLPIFLLPLLILTIGCNKTTGNNTSDSTLVEDSKVFVEAEDSAKLNNNAPSLTEVPISPFRRDTLIGKFDGVNIDTLIAEPYGEKPEVKENDLYSGWYYNWRVYSKKGTVKELKLENVTTGIKFVKEGDVDGDGKDEWGYVSEWPTSFWMRYNLYHNNNGRWKMLIEPTPIWLPHIDSEDKVYGGHSAEDLIQKSNKPGYLRVKFSDVRNDGGDFLLIDTLIRISHRK